MKRKAYTVLFAIFGMLLGQVLFGLLALALGWHEWPLTQYLLAVGFSAAGVIWGALAAPKCWELLYEGEDPLCKVPIYRRRTVRRKA